MLCMESYGRITPMAHMAFHPLRQRKSVCFLSPFGYLRRMDRRDPEVYGDFPIIRKRIKLKEL